MHPQRQQLCVHGPSDLRRDTATTPSPGPHDALIRVSACGICGSDLGYLALGGMRGPTGTPLPIGHEFSGTIESVGNAVRNLTPGMRVTINPDDNGIGGGGSEGGFSEWVLVRNALRGENVCPIPDHMDFETAALTEPLSVALHGVNRAQVGPGSKVVVLGAGVIGLGAIIALRHRGVSDIVVVDKQAERLAIALKLGASATINPSTEDLAERLGALHGQQSRYGFPMVGSDAFIDAAGAPALLQQITGLCRTRSRIVIIAVYRQPVPIDMVLVMAKEIEITGSIAYPDNEFAEVIEMLSQGKVNTGLLITHRFNFDEVERAFQQAKDASQALKVMVHITP